MRNFVILVALHMPRLKSWFFLGFLIVIVHAAHGQQLNRLNQSFTESTTNIPPAGWHTSIIDGEPGMVEWRFDNPGGRAVAFPMVAPFAVLDAGHLAESEEIYSIALESPGFFVAATERILLMYDHLFDPEEDARIKVQAFNGSTWVDIPASIYDLLTGGVLSEMIEITGQVQGVSNARIRFVWEGSKQGFWAIDNIRVLAAHPLDGGLTSVASPVMPFAADSQMVSVNLTNFGSQTLNNATFNWQFDGGDPQTENWTGSLTFGQTRAFDLAEFVFDDRPVNLKVWLASVNGMTDANPENDTLEITLRPAMQGNYTIGGETPDFIDFEAAANALNTAGVAGSVNFIVRPGEYLNLVYLGNIPEIEGIEDDYTILFESISGDATNTRLVNGTFGLTTLNIRGTRNIHFRGIGFSGHHAVLIDNQAAKITFEDCHFQASENCIRIIGGAHDVDIINCLFTSSETAVVAGSANSEQVNNIRVVGCNFSGSRSVSIFVANANRVDISSNIFTGIQRGILARNAADLTIRNNRVHVHSEFVHENTGIRLENVASSLLYNNYISAVGLAKTTGISIQNCTGSRLYFNSVNIETNDIDAKSSALDISDGVAHDIRNNILHIALRGYPVALTGNFELSHLDHNNYFHPRGLIGRVGTTSHTGLASWSFATQRDLNSISEYPFFAGIDNPAIGQSMLGGAATGAIGFLISEDIANNPRGVPPTIGAMEFLACRDNDAGISTIISPSGIVRGIEQIMVRLHNHGNLPINSVDIYWQVNDDPPQSFEWEASAQGGALAPGTGRDVVLTAGQDFSGGGLFRIRVWTEKPNGQNVDCNLANDLMTTEVAGALCGEYTVGGNNANFIRITDAVQALTTAGIFCDVTFRIIAEDYEEQFVIEDYPGDEEYTVTFVTASAPGLVTINFPYWEQSPVIIRGGKNLQFYGINFNGHNAMVIEEGAQNLEFQLCRFSVYDNPLATNNACIEIRGGAQNVRFKSNHFEGGYYSLWIHGDSPAVQGVELENNIFESPWHDAIITNPGHDVIVNGNLFRNIRRGILAGSNSGLMVSNNLFDIAQVAQEYNRAIYIEGGSAPLVFNNFIASAGPTATIGIRLKDVVNAMIYFNSIHIKNNNVTGTNHGMHIIGGNGNRIYNNIFKVNRNGFPISIEGSVTDLQLDHNNYYSSTGITGSYYGETLTGIENWRWETTKDANSLSVKPFFSSGSMLAFPFFNVGSDPVILSADGPDINQVLLSGTGIPVPGITTDIANEARDPDSPGIGARVYTQCGNDAGINMFISPLILVTGEEEIVVELQNHGSNDLQSVNIHWEVNGETQPTFGWPATAGSEELKTRDKAGISLGNYAFESGPYIIRAWTENPNGQPDDCNDENNEVSITVHAGLIGEYYIGGTGYDFENFTTAVDALNIAGIAGDVTFSVREGNYIESLIITDFRRPPEEFMVRFRKDPEESGTVSLIQPQFGDNALILKNTRNIHFDDIFFKGEDIIIIESSENISFNNCQFDIDNKGVEIKTGSRNIEFVNSRFDNGQNAIVIINQCQDIRIIGNAFNKQSAEPIFAIETLGLVIRGNTFLDLTDGLAVMESNDVSINANRIYITNFASGIKIRKSNLIRLYNNFIYSKENTSIVGIELYENTNVEAIYNTVSFFESITDSKGLYVIGGSDFLVKNNIFSNVVGSPVVFEQNPLRLTLSHNNYFNSSGLIGISNSRPYYDIPNDILDWSVDIGEIIFFREEPNFDPPETPIHNESKLKNAEPTSIVEEDIDGIRRHPVTPAIGCYEPFIDYGIDDIRLPAMDCNLPSISDLELLITQSGRKPNQDLRFTFFVNGMTEPLIIEVDGFAGYEIWWPIENLIIDVTQPGPYIFQASLLDVYDLDDQYDSNNSISKTWTKFPTPDVAIDFKYACESVDFTGSVIPDISDPISVTIWSFGDGASYTILDPSYQYAQGGLYTATFVVTTASGCVVEKQMEVQAVDQLLEVSEEVFQSCFGQDNGAIRLGIEGGLLPYEWSISPPVASSNPFLSFENLEHGNYSIVITDQLNCAVPIETEITELPALNPLISGPDSIYIPANVPFTFTTSEAYSGHGWTLQGNGADVTSDDETLDYRFDSIGTYTVTLEVFSGPSGECAETIEHVIHAKLKPLTLEAEVVQQYCQGDPAPEVTLLISGGVPPYSIVINGQQPPVETNDTIWSMPNPVPGETYLFNVTDDYNQEQAFTTSLVVPVAMNPVIILTDEDGVVYTGEFTGWVPFEVTLAFNYEDQPDSLVWKMEKLPETLAETLPETGAELTRRFEVPGEYIIVLETFTGEPSNCTETATFRIIADLKVEIITNDIITPNGDGVDDYFEVKHRGIIDLQLDILDRRGRKVFSYSGLNAVWDGNYGNGRPAPDGMYPYHISTIGYDRLLHKKSGVIKLIRDAVQVFPNPANTMITIDHKGSLTGPVNIEFLDLAANTVLIIRNLDLNDLAGLDISGLQEGLYLVRISDQSNIFHVKLRITR